MTVDRPMVVAYALLLCAAAVMVVPLPLPLLKNRRPGDRPSLPPRWRRALVVGLGSGAATALFVPDAVEVAVCVAAMGAGVGWYLPIKASSADRERHRADLGLVLELWAAAMSGGLSTLAALDSALGEVDRAMAGPQLTALARTAALLRLGADPGRAWAGVDTQPELAPIALAACRSALSGAELGALVWDQATSLRRSAVAESQRRSERGAVLMAAPLGLCFLPAFICLGLAPVVIALLDTLTIGR